MPARCVQARRMGGERRRRSCRHCWRARAQRAGTANCLLAVRRREREGAQGGPRGCVRGSCVGWERPPTPSRGGCSRRVVTTTTSGVCAALPAWTACCKSWRVARPARALRHYKRSRILAPRHRRGRPGRTRQGVRRTLCAWCANQGWSICIYTKRLPGAPYLYHPPRNPHPAAPGLRSEGIARLTQRRRVTAPLKAAAVPMASPPANET